MSTAIRKPPAQHPLERDPPRPPQILEDPVQGAEGAWSIWRDVLSGLIIFRRRTLERTNE